MVPYHADPDGRMVSELPGYCLLGRPEEPCRLRIGFHRERKTGPCFPVAVLRCATHGRASTLYPPGHVPYGRSAIAPVNTEWEVVASSTAEATGSLALRAAWEVTVFSAAVDADEGQLWPKCASCSDLRRRRTQGRDLETAAVLLGVSGELELRGREGIARTLGVPCLVLDERASAFAVATVYRERGHILAGLLAMLRPTRDLADRLLVAGELGGLWGAPSRWDPGGMERGPFRQFESRA